MTLSRLSVSHLRNIQHLEIELGAGVNLITWKLFIFWVRGVVLGVTA
jgi:hypothetical protein